MTGIFRCTQCDHVDHMDLVYPTGAHVDVDGFPLPLLCTVCHGNPWHNRMTYDRYDPEVHDVVNPPPTGQVLILPG